MDPFTQRMLERARARQEKIDQKLASSGQAVPKRKPLTENLPKPVKTPTKTPTKERDSVLSPKRTSKDLTQSSPSRSPSKKVPKSELNSTPRRKDVVITKKEFDSPKRNSSNSDVSVEINIMHRDDIQIEVQVEERDAPISIYDSTTDHGNGVKITEICDSPQKALDKQLNDLEHRKDRSGLRHDVKSRLDRLGVLYSDKPDLSSPIHRTELEFTAGTPPTEKEAAPRETTRDGKKKFGRLAALADQINNWEDDLSSHSSQPEPAKKGPAPKRPALKTDKDSSTLDVSIHSLNDINKALQASKSQQGKPINSRTFTRRPSTESQHLDKKIVAQLEGEGFRRVSASQSRLVYDFAATKKADRARQEPKHASTTPSAAAAPNMAAMVASKPPTVAKKPSIKKYKAPTPPVNANANVSEDDSCESDKDKENNVLEVEENDNDATVCKQKTEPVENKPEKGSPAVKRLAKLNGNADRNSVLSKAAMFEAGSPRAKEKDPAEMSLRERKALFEKNKGAAIVPKAPFGQAPSVKTLYGDKETPKSVRPVITAPKPNLKTKEDSSKEDVTDDNQPIGGIKGKLAALFNKEQTISESTITNKFKQEREKEMEMLQNRFQIKPKQSNHGHESDDERSDHEDGSENAPLMGSSVSLAQASRKPEIIANIPKDKTKSETALNGAIASREPEIVATQPNKRRSSQDSPVVLSVLDDVKRIKVNDKKEVKTNGAIQNPSLYPHLSDIETDTSNTQEEYSDCGNSSETEQEKLNKSDDWAETSFGREVMNVVKRNNSSYKKAVATDSETSNSDMNSELDELLDEALESDGPTPPKINKHQGNTLSSKSFTYEDKSKHFKSPVKVPPTPKGDKGNELVHSVSFYRRMQNAGSHPSTPMRVVRHASPPPPPDVEEPTVNVTTVRERIQGLRDEIAKHQTVISQASQALNLCASTVEFSGSTEQAEGERLLLLATHRRQACLHEVQRLQVEGAGKSAKKGEATLHLQGITVPFRRDYMRQLNADGAVGHHCVCLVKCGDRVLATAMRQTKPDSNVVSFPDDIRMDGLHGDFKITIEVYLLQASKEVLPHNVKYHINSKKSSSKLLTPKSKQSELKSLPTSSPGGPHAVRAPQFSLHGYCIFSVLQANRSTFTLSKVPAGSPLEGTINLTIKARVHVPPPSPHSAFLTAFDDVSGLGAWHRRWFRLTAPRLAYWKYPDDVQKKMPIGDIDLTTITSEKVTIAPRDLCARPNTILFETSVPAGLIIPDNDSLVYVKKQDGRIARRHLLAADTKQDRDVWLDVLNQALEYVRCMGGEEE